MSTTSYLEISFRHGKPLAAYLYLPRRSGDRSARTERHEAGLLVDYAPDGRPIGIEITAPTAATLDAVNRVLAAVREMPVAADDLSPLMTIAGR